MEIKKMLRFFLKLILGFVSFLLVYILGAFLLPKIPVNADVKQEGKTIPIYILSNGVHTDIVLPVKNHLFDWTKNIKYENTIAKDSTAQLIAFGWGDKGFYLETPTWADLKFSTALKAATGLSASAIHATFYKSLKENDRCKKIFVSESEYQKLVSFINNSFQLDSDNFMKIETNAVYGKHDAFYEAKGKYSVFHTCNTWTNNSLKAANQRAAFWTPTDTGIFYHYKK
ncbi:TIGR02117 family protein [Flavobacterium amnicola]|uniref:TIGR02117 family protein n=1 Tax=Flavobacterium amnicola TaxID=2506422 RepID=UPI0019D6FAD8|nr:TIGR02117 family protein [Flavobacterium amnicola]